jgi:hypothetical protein
MTIFHYLLLLHLDISLDSLLHPPQLHLSLVNVVHLVNAVARVINLDPNTFGLFRADFVTQEHVPGSIEMNHGCYRLVALANVDAKRFAAVSLDW